MGPPMTEDRRNCDKKYAVAPFHRNMLEVRMSYWHSTSNFVCSAHLENALLWSCISVYRTLQTCVITALGENFLKPRSQRYVHTFVRAPWAPIKAMRTRTLHLLYVISRTWSKKDTTDESSDRQQRRFFFFSLSEFIYPGVSDEKFKTGLCNLFLEFFDEVAHGENIPSLRHTHTHRCTMTVKSWLRDCCAALLSIMSRIVSVYTRVTRRGLPHPAWPHLCAQCAEAESCQDARTLPHPTAW